MIENYPKHIYEPIRYEVAENYLVHELRKLFETVGKNYPDVLETDIRKLKNSKELANPRDFWNGFHGICMGFKLKIQLIYIVTAENVRWERKMVPINNIRFGAELDQTREISAGKLLAKEVRDFYLDPINMEKRNKYLKIAGNYFDDNLRGKDPLSAFVLSNQPSQEVTIFDGNGRLGRIVLSPDINEVDCYVGEFTSESKVPTNTWVPTTLLMENLYYAKKAYDRGDNSTFNKYLEVVADMVKDSEAGRFDLIDRSISSSQPFRDETMRMLNELGIS